MDGFAIRAIHPSYPSELSIRAIHPRPERRGFPLNSGKKFKERFLTTKPETIALHIGKEIHGLDMEDDYRTDHDGFTIKKSSL